MLPFLFPGIGDCSVIAAWAGPDRRWCLQAHPRAQWSFSLNMEPKLLVKCSLSEQSTLGEKNHCFTQICVTWSRTLPALSREKREVKTLTLGSGMWIPSSAGEKASGPGLNRETHKGACWHTHTWLPLWLSGESFFEEKRIYSGVKF